MQFSGLVIGGAMFLAIWGGHVGVRWLEAHSVRVWPPALLLFLAGTGLNLYALFGSRDVLPGGLCSVVGFTLLWDSLEVYRQMWRVLHSHAPANPANPRHAAYLAAGKGTLVDLLKREPQGSRYEPPAPQAAAPVVPTFAASCPICHDASCILSQRRAAVLRQDWNAVRGWRTTEVQA